MAILTFIIGYFLGTAVVLFIIFRGIKEDQE